MIGIDGGGTKTEFVLFTEEGRILNRIQLEGCNTNSCGLERTFKILKSGIDVLLTNRSEVSGIFEGISGFASGDNLEA